MKKKARAGPPSVDEKMQRLHGELKSENVRIGELLKEARRRAGLSQQRLAALAAVGRMTVVRYERGEVSKYAELLRMVEAIDSASPHLGLKSTLDGMRGTALKHDASMMVVRRAEEGKPVSDELHDVVELLGELGPEERTEIFGVIKGFVIGSRHRKRD